MNKLLKKLKKAHRRKLKAYRKGDSDRAHKYLLRERELDDQIRELIGPPATKPLSHTPDND